MQLDLRLYLLSERPRWRDLPGVYEDDPECLYIPLDVALCFAEELLEELLDVPEAQTNNLTLWGDLVITIDGEVWNDWFAEDLHMALGWLQGVARLLTTGRPVHTFVWSMSHLELREVGDHISIFDGERGGAEVFPERHVPRQQFLQKLAREGRHLFALLDTLDRLLDARPITPQTEAARQHFATIRRTYLRTLAVIENASNNITPAQQDTL